jgi:hypothetical protein
VIENVSQKVNTFGVVDGMTLLDVGGSEEGRSLQRAVACVDTHSEYSMIP